MRHVILWLANGIFCLMHACSRVVRSTGNQTTCLVKRDGETAKHCVGVVAQRLLELAHGDVGLQHRVVEQHATFFGKIDRVDEAGVLFLKEFVQTLNNRHPRIAATHVLSVNLSRSLTSATILSSWENTDAKSPPAWRLRHERALPQHVTVATSLPLHTNFILHENPPRMKKSKTTARTRKKIKYSAYNLTIINDSKRDE